MSKGRYGNVIILVALAALMVLPAVAGADDTDDTELFMTRANPNVLLLTDTSSSMGTTDSAAQPPVPLLAPGSGSGNRRVDIIWNVLYSLLNADGSKPGSTLVSTAVLSETVSKNATKLYVTQGTYGNFDNVPLNSQVQLIGTASQETVTYLGRGTETKTTGGKTTTKYRFDISPVGNKSLGYSIGETVQYSYSASYAYSSPQSQTDAFIPGTRATAYENNINNTDMDFLKVRFGLMTYNGSSGGITRNAINPSTDNNYPPFNPSHNAIWQNVKQYVNTGASTPTTLALMNQVPTFFSNAYDTNATCRKNYVVLITDGEDTRGKGSESYTDPRYYYPTDFSDKGNMLNIPCSNPDQYSGCYVKPATLPSYNSASLLDSPANTVSNKYFPDAWQAADTAIPGGQVRRNKWLLEQGKILKDQGIELYVVGVGMSGTQQDRPHAVVQRDVLRRLAEQQGRLPVPVAVGSDTSTALAPLKEAWYNIGTGYNGTAEDNTIGIGSDGRSRVFFGTSGEEIANGITQILRNITTASESFTAPTVATVRTTDKNYLYTASFKPAARPATFWEGHINAYTLNTDNTTTLQWDGAAPASSSVPLSSAASTRRIYTAQWNTLSPTRWSPTPLEFNSTNIDNGALLVDNPTLAAAIVAYVRGAHDNNTELGDIFHSKPLLVGSPSTVYFDEGYSAFAALKKNRPRVLYAGSNDGMLHAFLAGVYASGVFTSGTGEELFGFVPNLLLSNLQRLIPGDATTHSYFVDSSPRVADVWLDDNDDNIKQSSEWRTVLVSGMRKGGGGYFALDVTDPPAGGASSSYPKVLWEYSDENVIYQSWSEPFIAKVRIQDNPPSGPVKDRFVAIVGAGPGITGSSIGKSVLVIDIKTGNILRTFSGTGYENAFVASPTGTLDTSGYLQFVYMPDIAGNLWKFDFRFTGLKTSNPSYKEWTGTKLFEAASGGQPAYHRAEVAYTNIGGTTRFVFYGTGNQEAPVTDTQSGKFYAILDSDDFFPNSPVQETTATVPDLSGSILGGNGTQGTNGWRIDFGSLNSTVVPYDLLTHAGEKMLSDPTIFYGKVYFTTFTPHRNDPCSGGGIARVYGLNYLTGGSGLMADASINAQETSGGRKLVPYHVFGTSGVASSPSLSINPSGQSSLFIGFSEASVLEMKIDSPLKLKTLKSWREIY